MVAKLKSPFTQDLHHATFAIARGSRNHVENFLGMMCVFGLTLSLIISDYSVLNLAFPALSRLFQEWLNSDFS